MKLAVITLKRAGLRFYVLAVVDPLGMVIRIGMVSEVGVN